MASDFYDCGLTLAQIERMLDETGFDYENIGVPAMRATFGIEDRRDGCADCCGRIPDRVLRRFDPLVPTLIYRLGKQNNA